MLNASISTRFTQRKWSKNGTFRMSGEVLAGRLMLSADGIVSVQTASFEIAPPIEGQNLRFSFGDVFDWPGEALEGIRDVAEDVGGWIRDTVDDVADYLKPAWEAVEGLVAAVESSLEKVEEVVESVSESLEKIVDHLEAIAEKGGEILSEAEGLIAVITQLVALFSGESSVETASAKAIIELQRLIGDESDAELLLCQILPIYSRDKVSLQIHDVNPTSADVGITGFPYQLGRIEYLTDTGWKLQERVPGDTNRAQLTGLIGNSQYTFRISVDSGCLGVNPISDPIVVNTPQLAGVSEDVNGVVTVRAGDGNDRADVYQRNGENYVRINGKKGKLSDELTGAIFYGGAGNDYLRLRVNVPGTFYGQRGDDKMVGAGRNDVFYGGPGEDSGWGRGGDDFFKMGRGKVNRIFGGRGDHDKATVGPNDIVRRVEEIVWIGETPESIEAQIEDVSTQLATVTQERASVVFSQTVLHLQLQLLYEASQKEQADVAAATSHLTVMQQQKAEAKGDLERVNARIQAAEANGAKPRRMNQLFAIKEVRKPIFIAAKQAAKAANAELAIQVAELDAVMAQLASARRAAREGDAMVVEKQRNVRAIESYLAELQQELDSVLVAIG